MKRILSLFIAIVVVLSLSSCKTDESTQVEKVGVPIEAGWTYETLKECILINDRKADVPISLKNFGDDFEFQIFYQSDDNALVDVNINYDGKYVGAARIVDESLSGDIYNGYVKSVIFSENCPIYVNGLSFCSNMKDVEKYFGAFDYVTQTSCSSTVQVDIDDNSQFIVRITCNESGNVEHISFSIGDLEK